MKKLFLYPVRNPDNPYGITFKRLNEKYADMGQIGFLASKRVDAKLVLPEAVKYLQQKA